MGFGLLGARLTQAESVPVTLDLFPLTSTGAAIPENFLGLSFGSKTLLTSSEGGHFFSLTNKPLITLFHNLGLRHLRVGGTTVEYPAATRIPSEADIDSFFAFAEAAGVKKVIYTLRLLETDPAVSYAATNAALAKYIWAHHRPLLEHFALGNEPDLRKVFGHDVAIKDFDSYLLRWRRDADAIRQAVPAATFAGPDASGNTVWARQFVRALAPAGFVALLTEHYYAAGRGRGVTVGAGIEAILSNRRQEAYENLYDSIKGLAAELPYRFTEANDHYSGGVTNASDAMAGALWALDFLHWWAARGVSGVDFHNTQWVVNDVVTRHADGSIGINPKGYGLKAFSLCGPGRILPIQLRHNEGLNLTAYAVAGPDCIYVTVINREYGPQGRTAQLTLPVLAGAKIPQTMYLTAPENEAGATAGVTLGGQTLTGEKAWTDPWENVSSSIKNGHFELILPKASAVLVKLAVK